MSNSVRARTGRWAVLAVVLLAVGLAALAAVYLLRDNAPERDGALPRARDENAAVAAGFPAPLDAAATQTYLAGEGSALLAMHRSAVEQLVAGSADAGCRERAAALQAVLSADQAYVLVAGVPDEPLREVLSDERAALGRTFTRCADPSVTDASADLVSAVALADLRLDALGVAR